MRPPSGNALTLFATGIALSLQLIAAYSRTFNSVGPALRQLVIASESGYQAMNGFGRKPSPVCSR